MTTPAEAKLGFGLPAHIPCPVHQGEDPNLSIWVREDGSIGLKCHSHGCKPKDIAQALGIRTASRGPVQPPEDKPPDDEHLTEFEGYTGYAYRLAQEDPALVAAFLAEKGISAPAEWVIEEFGMGRQAGSPTITLPLVTAKEQTDCIPPGRVVGVTIRQRAGDGWSRKNRYGSWMGVLYGEHRDQGHPDVLLCEGQTDTIEAAWQLRDKPVDVFGLPRGAHANIAGAFRQRVGDRRVHLALDVDDAGREATGLWTNSLNGQVVGVLPIPEGHDILSGGVPVEELLEAEERPMTIQEFVTMWKAAVPDGEYIDPADIPTFGAWKQIQRKDAYFDQKLNKDGDELTPAFNPPRLAQDILDEFKLTRGPGGGLWRDAGGVYRPDAEDLVADTVRRVLDGEFRKNRLAEVMAYCMTLPIEITADPPPDNILNLANGVLDLDTLALRERQEHEKFTYQIPVPWVPNATCPAIEAFVQEVVPPDCPPLVAEVFGLALMPTWRFRRAVMLLGEGNNGKSIILALLRNLLGLANVSAESLHDLSEDRFASANLFSKLANVCGDLDPRPVERSDMFKKLTGGDLISAQRKYGQPFKFVNYATPIFSANEWPVSHDQTNAYFQRWVPVPFTQFFREDGPLQPGEKRADPKLLDRLTTPEELRGLLVRAVAGARRLRERGGFDIPQSVREALAEYRQYADTVLAWSTESLFVQVETLHSRDAVYGHYVEWCKKNGRRPVATRSFWPKLRKFYKDADVDFDTWMPTPGGGRAVRGLQLTKLGFVEVA